MNISKHDFRLKFVKADFDFFEENCNFNEEQLKVFNCLKKDWLTDKIAMELCYSTSKVNRIIKQVKAKMIKALDIFNEKYYL